MPVMVMQWNHNSKASFNEKARDKNQSKPLKCWQCLVPLIHSLILLNGIWFWNIACALTFAYVSIVMRSQFKKFKCSNDMCGAEWNDSKKSLFIKVSV